MKGDVDLSIVKDLLSGPHIYSHRFQTKTIQVGSRQRLHRSCPNKSRRQKCSLNHVWQKWDSDDAHVLGYFDLVSLAMVVEVQRGKETGFFEPKHHSVCRSEPTRRDLCRPRQSCLYQQQPLKISDDLSIRKVIASQISRGVSPGMFNFIVTGNGQLRPLDANT